MIRFYASMLAMLLSVAVVAQSTGIEWQQPIGGNLADYLSKSLVSGDGNFIFAGSCNRSGTGNDIRVSKVSPNGTVIWTKYLGGSASEGFLDFTGTADGGFIVTATTLSGDGDVVGFHGPASGSNYDIWIVKLSSSGAIQWQRCIGGTGTETFKQTLVHPDGSVAVLGITLSSNGDFMFPGSFLIKLNANGNLLFNASLGSDRTSVSKMILKPNGNLLVIGDNILQGNHGMRDLSVWEVNTAGGFVSGSSYGSLGGSLDEFSTDVLQTGASQFTVLATTASTNVTGAHGGNDLWLITYNNSGTILWQKALGGSGTEGASSLYFNAADSSIIIAASSTSNDGDVSGNHGGSDIWMVKLSNAGNVVWSKCLGGTGSESATQIKADAANQVFVLGTTNSNDGDVTGYHGGTDEWFVKLGANGSLDWQKTLGGSLQEKPKSFTIETDGFTLLSATPSQDGDVQGMHYSSYVLGGTTFYNDDIWVVSLNSTGGMNWQKPLGGFGNESPVNVVKLQGKYFVSGNTASNDGDVFGLQGSNNMWLVKLGPTNVIKGNVFVDANGNGIKDAGELYYNDVIVKSEKAGYSRASIPYNGQFKNEVDTGTFATAITLNNPYFSVVPVVHSSSFATYFAIDSVDFALQPLLGKRDVKVNIVNTNGARPGFNSGYTLYYKNVGTDTVAAGSVTMIKDSGTTFISAVPVPDSIAGDTLIWNYHNLQPDQVASITISLNNKTAPAVNIGDTLMHTVFIDPATNDVLPGNNSDTIRQIVTGSFDPNDKLENHAGYISLANAAGRDALGYVVNFQNVGTDTAFSVVIRDTLSDKLDWNTLQIVGSSHPSSLQITDGNKLTWTFNNSKLPPAGTNEPASHGYIAYSIKPIAGLQAGNTINNTASIYFDYNAAVVTNTVVTTVLPDPVAQPVIGGLVNNYCSSEAASKVKIVNLPGNSATVTVKLDNTVLPVATDSSITLSVAGLTGGAHTLSVSFANSVGTKTTTAAFTVGAAVTPDVNITASTTLVTNITNPVTVTATNAAGGGKAPQFTFAWNNSFTNLLQAESSNNTLSITPASLAVGDNKIYVKMKTSEVCYTAATNTDSITIRRDQSTGIIDADYPNQVIAVYPNPFRGPVTVSGLSTAKTYLLTVYDLNGKLVTSKKVANRTTAEVNGLKNAPGVYWLRIYDDKKNITIGTVKLIKQ